VDRRISETSIDFRVCRSSFEQDDLFTDRPESVKPNARAAKLVSFTISHAAGQLTGSVVQRPSTERLSDEAESSHRDFVKRTVKNLRTVDLIVNNDVNRPGE
jgi:hypothetical protein